MRKIATKTKHALHKVQHSRVAHHGHHLVYAVYYGLALLDDSGARFWVVLGIFSFHVLATVTGE